LIKENQVTKPIISYYAMFAPLSSLKPFEFAWQTSSLLFCIENRKNLVELHIKSPTKQNQQKKNPRNSRLSLIFEVFLLFVYNRIQKEKKLCKQMKKYPFCNLFPTFGFNAISFFFGKLHYCGPFF
jgi:hypothetical protein